MQLREIRRKVNPEDEGIRRLAMETYEKNLELYKGKSEQWMIRVTADELAMKKETLCQLLEECYEADGNDKAN